MQILWQLIVGLIVGVIARLLLPGREAFPAGVVGWILTALLGVAGALVGGWLGSVLLPWADAGYTAGWIMSIIGAILLLVIFRLIFGRGSTSV